MQDANQRASDNSNGSLVNHRNRSRDDESMMNSSFSDGIKIERIGGERPKPLPSKGVDRISNDFHMSSVSSQMGDNNSFHSNRANLGRKTKLSVPNMNTRQSEVEKPTMPGHISIPIR